MYPSGAREFCDGVGVVWEYSLLLEGLWEERRRYGHLINRNGMLEAQLWATKVRLSFKPFVAVPLGSMHYNRDNGLG